MKMKNTKNGIAEKLLIALLATIAIISVSYADPFGPIVTYVSNSTAVIQTSTLENNPDMHGGVIAVVNFYATQQNTHWKAFVGNVSGLITLQDADNYSIYKWDLASSGGEVYASRGNAITWTTIVCANASHVDVEMALLNHTPIYTPTDNISATFDDDAYNHSRIIAGPSDISVNSCPFSTNLYINGSVQAHGSSNFEETILYDSTSSKIVYSSLIYNSLEGYHPGYLFDYQILLPEKGEPSFTGVTPYYFYIELI